MIAHFILKSPEIRERAAEYVRALPDKPVVEVTIKVFHKNRSTEANRYYFGVCVQTLGRELGYRVDEMHDILLMGYFGIEEKTFRGKTYLFPKRRTTSPDIVNSHEFQGLTQYAQQIASEMGIQLPDQREDLCMT